MNKEIFRKKTIKKITSPEEMDRYISVSNPSIWLVLSAIIILMISFCVWGIFGKLETTVLVSGNIENGVMETVLTGENADKVDAGMPVYLDNKNVGTVESIHHEDDIVAQITTMNIADGKYELSIVVESISPIYFILN